MFFKHNDRTQQSRFHLMTREEPYLEKLWLKNIRSMDKVQITANQPNKKLTKGAVLRKHETSSLARFDHSFVRNALLEMVKGVFKL
jgi:hypothetical protein